MTIFGRRHRRKYLIPETWITPYNPEVVKDGGRVATSANFGADETDEPPLDPDAIDRAYWHHRARRHARVERRRATRRAGARFWFFLLVLLAVTVAFVVFIAHDVQRLFGI
ncbi:MAG: hypothetical protein ABI927_01700 [Gaiellaceae bacterium]